MQTRNHRGFTLIELMIVVVIIGIIAAVAYPNYTSYVTQTRRSDAQSALLNLANLQERFFTECNQYATSLTATRDCTNLGLGLPNSLSPERHYALSLAAGILNRDGSTSASCGAYTCGFTAIANPGGTGASGRQAGDGRLMTNARGQKFWDRNNDGDYADANEDRWTK